MSPTLSDSDIVLVRRGDTAVRPGLVVIVVWPGQLSVKRVVKADVGGWFVVGDNPAGSTDSRELGPARVVGVVRWRLWPRPGPVR
jgi:phage repressor protein C with HTH and peptisase S24 domain